MVYDPRIAANAILDIRDNLNRPTTNLELQKLLYFCHAYHLNRHNAPLVSGVFEAWKNGPVNPAVYRAFRDFVAQPITKRAERRDYRNNVYVTLINNIPKTILNYMYDDVKRLSELSAWELVDLSHAPNGPWHYVVEKSKTGFVAGMRINDDITKERFAHLKRTISSDARSISRTIVEPFLE